MPAASPAIRGYFKTRKECSYVSVLMYCFSPGSAPARATGNGFWWSSRRLKMDWADERASRVINTPWFEQHNEVAIADALRQIVEECKAEAEKVRNSHLSTGSAYEPLDWKKHHDQSCGASQVMDAISERFK